MFHILNFIRKYFKKKKQCIPTRSECFRLMKEYGMPAHIKTHSLKVRNVSVYLAKELNKKGEGLDVKLIEAGALLHDLVKMHCINSEANHDEVGADLLRAIGYDKLALIVEQHVHLEPHDDLRITEEEIVHYADKRVLHDQLVTLPERFYDAKERYVKGNMFILEKIKKTEEMAYQLEEKIFSKLDVKPEDLQEILKD